MAVYRSPVNGLVITPMMTSPQSRSGARLSSAVDTACVRSEKPIPYVVESGRYDYARGQFRAGAHSMSRVSISAAQLWLTLHAFRADTWIFLISQPQPTLWYGPVQ